MTHRLITATELAQFEEYLRGPVGLTAILGVQEPLDLTPLRLVTEVRRLADLEAHLRKDRDRMEDQYFATRIELDNVRKMLDDANGREQDQLSIIETLASRIDTMEIDAAAAAGRERHLEHIVGEFKKRWPQVYDMLNKPVPMCAEPVKCNHDPEHNPVTGRTYCEKCGETMP